MSNPIEWLLSGDTGISSRTICAVLTGTPYRGSSFFGPDVPHDPDDFGRCYRLLQRFPEWRKRLGKVAGAYPKWGPMVDAWDELTALYEQCCGPAGEYVWEENKATARKLFNRLRELEEAGRRADGWVEDGPGCWRKEASR